ncbi:MAG: hypothetical protein K6A70_10730 [Erysipelotrichaceae bacterium]|nr:hypothetical protein [Erysipelotrichaceae bacterium]
MKKMTVKLKSERGESIAETLVALLIAALALLMLASVITSSTRIITNSNNKIKEYINKDLTVSQQGSAGTAATVEYRDENNTKQLISYDSSDYCPVEVFKNDVISNKVVVSYKKAVSAGG